MPEKKQITIFTDGACSGNPGPGGWGAVLVLPNKQVRELGGGGFNVTNNQMEMMAAIEASSFVAKIKGDVTIFTDSAYLVNGITKWADSWVRNGWKNSSGEEVANRQLWERLIEVVNKKKTTGSIKWELIPGHEGIAGNERADSIAVAYSKGEQPDLYDGSLSEYDIEIFPVPERKVARTKEQIVYLSLVDGVLMRHQTWVECEMRVKGRRGAKFKKVSNVHEEHVILQQWGINR